MFNVDKLVAEQNNGCFISGISGTRQVVFITLYYYIYTYYIIRLRRRVAGKILGQQVALERAVVFSYITPWRRRFGL